jgi:hypothetical protein
MILMSKPFSAMERKEILDGLLYVIDEYGRLSDACGDKPVKDEATEIRMEQLSQMSRQLCDRYLDGLPLRALSRSPFTGEVLYRAIDDFGLDGFWWNSESPLRPFEERMESFFGLDGAVKVSGAIEEMPFIATPGPDVPFVLPRLLNYPQVMAVVSCLKIGNHTGYPIAYFSQPMLEDVERVNDWGTHAYWCSEEIAGIKGTAGFPVYAQNSSFAYDFELDKWILSGKLLWIEPNDNTLTLHADISKCPYLNLPGAKHRQYIEYGTVRMESDIQYSRSDDFPPEHPDVLIDRNENGER